MAQLNLGITDFLLIGCMLAISASVGLYFRFTGGRQKTTHEFLHAGRNMKIGPVAFSLMATYLSAISMLGVPAETYMYGIQNILWLIGMPVGGLFSVYGFLPVFFDMKVSTAYEYLEQRFGKIVRTVTSFLFIIQMILYMAVVLYAPSLALNAVTSLSTWTSVILLSVVCTFYCSLGGLKAVLWTDVFQSFLMYFSIISVVVGVAAKIGFKEIFQINEEGGRLIFFNMSIDMTERYTFWSSVLSGILFSLHTFGTNQAQIQRMMSVGSLERAQQALNWSIPLIFLYSLFNFLDGAAIYALFHDCDPMKDPNTGLSKPDQLMPLSIVQLFSSIPGLSGLCIAGVFSASLSTISSAVNSLTAVSIEDFIRPFCGSKLTDAKAAFLAKFIAAGYGGMALLMTYVVANFRGVMEASNILFGMIGGPVLGLYILGMFTTRSNEKGVLIGLLSGCTVNAWLGFASYVVQAPVPALPQSIAGCNTTSIFNSTVIPEEIIEPERDIFLLYRLSYVWLPYIGTLTVILVGYTASFIISYFMDIPEVSLHTLSPFVRKLYAKNEKSEKAKNAGTLSGVEMTTKSSEAQDSGTGEQTVKY